MPKPHLGLDITYIRIRNEWMYLVVLMGWYSRYIVSWEIDQTLEMPFVLKALDAALLEDKPNITNSDQGSHFTSSRYTKPPIDAGVRISMNSRCRVLDNTFIERLWRSLKYENVYIN